MKYYSLGWESIMQLVRLLEIFKLRLPVRGLSRLVFSLPSVSESECVCVYTCSRSVDSLELQLYIVPWVFFFLLLVYCPLRRCVIGLLEAASLVLLAVHRQRERNTLV